jgi:homopolymeric O-antigen transport system permease protein
MAAQEDVAMGATIPIGADGAVPVPTRRDVHGRRRVYTPRRALDLRVRHALHFPRTIGHFGWVFVTRKTRGMWLGILWVPLRPALDMLSKGFVFGGLLAVQSGDRPYLIFLTVGTAAWTFFERAAYWSFKGPQIHRRIIGRSQVPWLTITFAAFIPATVEALLYALTAIITLFYYLFTQGVFYLTLDKTTFFSVIGAAMLALYAIAWGTITGPLVVKIPDMRFVLRYVLSALYFVTPIIYATTKIPEQYRAIAEYNPLSAPIELFKYGLIGTGPPTSASIVTSVVGLATLLPLGLILVSRIERGSHRRL